MRPPCAGARLDSHCARRGHSTASCSLRNAPKWPMRRTARSAGAIRCTSLRAFSYSETRLWVPRRVIISSSVTDSASTGNRALAYWRRTGSPSAPTL